MQKKLLNIINVDFDATGQLLITYSAFNKYFKKKKGGGEYNEAMHHVFTDFKKFMTWLGGWSFIIFSMSLVSP